MNPQIYIFNAVRLISAAVLTLVVGLATADTLLPLTPSLDGGQVVRGNQYQYLVTPSNTGWDQLGAIRNSDKWQASNVDTLNVTATGVLWVRIPLGLPPKGNSNWRLEVRWPHISRVDMAVWDENQGLSDIRRAGKGIPISELETISKNILFPFHLQPDTPATLYLRFPESGFVYLPMMLFSAKDYESHNTARLVFFSMAFGIMLVMILYNLSLYFAVRDRMYLFYSNTVLSSLLYILAVSGYGRIVFWGNNHWLDVHASSVFAAYCFFSVNYFFRVFMDLSRYSSWMLKANTFFLIGFALLLVVTFTPYLAYGVILIGSLSSLNAIIIFITAVLVWRRGNSSAKYFIISWTGIGISTTFMVLTLRGEIDYYPSLEYMQTLGFVLEIVLLSLALADRIRRQRLAKEHAQISLLRLQEKTNKQLEEQVAQRTRELESAMVDLKSANRELSNLTKLDPLTKLYNRRHFDEVGANEIARAQRAKHCLAVMMIDIDHFKSINDTYGHVVGDQCLKLVAKCISQIVRKPSDVVARYGGEEFSLILPETDEQGVYALAERIRTAVEDIALDFDGKTIRMTASFGVSCRVPLAEDTVNSLVESADAALYRAKENGRNQVAIAASSL